MLTTAQQRRHAEILRGRDPSPEAQAVAAEIEAQAELDDALANRPSVVSPSAQMVEWVPILGHIKREGGRITYIERAWLQADVDRARAQGVDIAWQWCHDPMAGLRQGELIRIWIGTRETGPLLQWDRYSRRWFVLCNQRGYGSNWACGGRWGCDDKDGRRTLAIALMHLPVETAEQIRRVV
jgi:hypothetical protein